MEGFSQTPFHFFLLRSSQITPRNNVMTYIRLGNSLANTSFQNSSFLFHGIQLLKCSCICLELNSKGLYLSLKTNWKILVLYSRSFTSWSCKDGKEKCKKEWSSCKVGFIIKSYVHTTPDRFSCWHEMLSGIVWTPIRYVTIRYGFRADTKCYLV